MHCWQTQGCEVSVGCCPYSGGGREAVGLRVWARHCGNPPALDRRLPIPLVWG